MAIPLRYLQRIFPLKKTPILHGLADSLNKFTDVFYKQELNYKRAFILNNQIFKRGPGDLRILDLEFFGGKNKPDYMSKISNITYLDCWSGREFVTRADLNAKFLCEMSEVTFFRLWSALLFLRANITRDFTNEGKSTSLIEFMSSFKKGSRYCRNIFSKIRRQKLTPARRNL